MNVPRKFRLDRRSFLRGTGVTMALPYLEAMMPSSALASPAPQAVPRMGMFYFGTGMNTREFFPKDFGPDYTTTRILEPLEKLRGEFTVLSGTWLEKGGGHKGAYPFATSIEEGAKQTVSPDQLAAEVLGQDTRFPSLIMSVDRGTNFGSNAIATISWNRQGVPLAAENNPKALFDRMFRPDSADQAATRDVRFRRRGSVLDVVNENAKRLNQKLGQADREQLDQYFNSVRELEKSLAREIDWADTPKPIPETDDLHGTYDESMAGPEGSGDYLYDDYAKMMYDLIALAFQTDSTRVASYVVRKELAGGVYPEFDVSKGYHALSHHGNDPKNLDELAKVDAIYMQHWAYFLDRLKSIKDGDATLLDRTVLGYSSGMGMGHSKTALPTMVSGGRGLGLKHHGHLDLGNTRLSSLWHTMLDRCGVAVGIDQPFQDSEGVIKELVA